MQIDFAIHDASIMREATGDHHRFINGMEVIVQVTVDAIVPFGAMVRIVVADDEVDVTTDDLRHVATDVSTRNISENKETIIFPDSGVDIVDENSVHLTNRPEWTIAQSDDVLVIKV